MIQNVLDNAIFTFPLLKCCSLDGINDINFEHFERLLYIGFPALKALGPVFPCLREFQGFIGDFITLSLDHSPRPFEFLALSNDLHDVNTNLE